MVKQEYSRYCYLIDQLSSLLLDLQVRIAEGEHPQDIKESDYFTERGEFRVDSEGSPTLLNCLMYKLSYYRFMIKVNQNRKTTKSSTLIGNQNLDNTATSGSAS